MSGLLQLVLLAIVCYPAVIAEYAERYGIAYLINPKNLPTESNGLIEQPANLERAYFQTPYNFLLVRLLPKEFVFDIISSGRFRNEDDQNKRMRRSAGRGGGGCGGGCRGYGGGGYGGGGYGGARGPGYGRGGGGGSAWSQSSSSAGASGWG